MKEEQEEWCRQRGGEWQGKQNDKEEKERENEKTAKNMKEDEGEKE